MGLEQFGHDLHSQGLSQEDTGNRTDFSASEASKVQIMALICVNLLPETALFSLSFEQTS